MAQEIIKQGKIPASNSLVYKENIRIADNIIGKYISLDGFKTFYNPGKGLQISLPNTESTTVTKNFVNSGNKSLSNYHTGWGDTDQHVGGYITYALVSPTVNTINGVGSSNINIVRNFGVSVSNQFNFNNIPIPNDRLLTVNETGKYTINFRVNGTVAAWKAGNNNNNIAGMALLTQIKVNSTIEDIGYADLAPQPGITYSDMRLSGALSYNCNYTKTIDLNQGDYVQLYTKYVVYNPGGKRYGNNKDLDLYFNINHNNYYLSIDQVSTNGPSNTYYTNPQNLQQFNVSEINYYGNSRDTLKLSGSTLMG